MKNIPVFLVILVLMSTFAAGEGYLVKFNGKADDKAVVDSGGQVTFKYKHLPDVIAVEIPEQALNGLMKNPNVIDVLPDVEHRIDAKPVISKKPVPPVDPPEPVVQSVPWGVEKIKSLDAPNRGAGVKVCILDTGIDTDHPDLPQAYLGKTFVPRTKSFEDDNGHGTHVAGTIAAIDNEIGVVGVAPGVQLLIGKVLNKQGSGYLSWIIAGMDWCVDNGADVISMSLGSDTAYPESYILPYSSMALVVAAAGNDNSAVDYPAAFGSVVAVSALNSADEKAWFSSYGPEVEISAPGVDILSTTKGGSYGTMSGTSMATPHAAAVAAIAIAAGKDARSTLRSTADDIILVPDTYEGFDIYYGWGRVDAALLNDGPFYRS